jgi:small GTP-binding protein
MISLRKKICLMGDFSVGKTSLVRRFIYNRYDDRYISTVGVKVSRKTVNLSKNEELLEVTMMIWDLAGGEEFNQVQGSYLRGADGAILVCDLTRPGTLAHLDTQAHNFFRVNPKGKVIIAANKRDLVNQISLTDDEVRAFADNYDTRHFSTSAKTGDDVELAFRYLAELL